MKISSATSVGKIRALNEDAFYVAPLANNSLLAVVADGMGGHNAGEVASNEAINVIRDVATENEHEAKEVLIEALNVANSTVYKMSQDKTTLSGMGTTITACLVSDEKVTAAQVGDSRLYLIRDNKIIQTAKHGSDEQWFSLTSALFAGHKNLCTGCCLGERIFSMLFLDKVFTERNKEQYTKHSTQQRADKHLHE